MESLYVCHFSNGHIKVGRSIDPTARIAQHADRVACMGIELIEHAVFECDGTAAPRETLLISRCADAARARFQNEWFARLDYQDVCVWAHEYATRPLPEGDMQSRGFGRRLQEVRKARGVTQVELAKGLGPDGTDLGKAAVSHWEVSRGSPSVLQLKLICERLAVSADHLLDLPQFERA
jgi:DNA-binding XRE family transcriptional regulator